MTEDKCSTGRILLIVVFGLAASIDAFGVFAAMQQRPASRPATGKPAEQAKFKAIWEPVNVPEDIELLSIHFVNAMWAKPAAITTRRFISKPNYLANRIRGRI